MGYKTSRGNTSATPPELGLRFQTPSLSPLMSVTLSCVLSEVNFWDTAYTLTNQKLIARAGVSPSKSAHETCWQIEPAIVHQYDEQRGNDVLHSRTYLTTLQTYEDQR